MGDWISTNNFRRIKSLLSFYRFVSKMLYFVSPLLINPAKFLMTHLPIPITTWVCLRSLIRLARLQVMPPNSRRANQWTTIYQYYKSTNFLCTTWKQLSDEKVSINSLADEVKQIGHLSLCNLIWFFYGNKFWEFLNEYLENIYLFNIQKYL